MRHTTTAMMTRRPHTRRLDCSLVATFGFVRHRSASGYSHGAEPRHRPRHLLPAGPGSQPGQPMLPPTNTAVVLGAVLGRDGPQVAFAEDQDAVGEFGSGCADESVGVAVRSRTSRWDFHCVDLGVGQDGVERVSGPASVGRGRGTGRWRCGRRGPSAGCGLAGWSRRRSGGWSSPSRSSSVLVNPRGTDGRYLRSGTGSTIAASGTGPSTGLRGRHEPSANPRDSLVARRAADRGAEIMPGTGDHQSPLVSGVCSKLAPHRPPALGTHGPLTWCDRALGDQIRVLKIR